MTLIECRFAFIALFAISSEECDRSSSTYVIEARFEDIIKLAKRLRT